MRAEPVHLTERTDDFTAEQLADAACRYGIQMELLASRACAGFCSVEEGLAWVADLRAWENNATEAHVMLWCEGYRTPTIRLDQDPYAYVYSWRAFFRNIWHWIRPQMVAELDWYGQHVAAKH